jgi:ABC-type sugar transport system permease subunit
MKFLSNKRTIGYFFILPWIIGFLVFTAIPIGYSLYLSLNNVVITATGIETTAVGMHNFRRVVTEDMEFLRLVWTFFVETVISVPLIVVLALIMAILLNQRVKGRSLFRTIFFLPVIISSGSVLNVLIDLEITTIPALMRLDFFMALQMASGNIFADILVFILTNFILLLWLSGVQILIFLAALQKTDAGVYEAARIDGASTWEIFWRITLPGLMPMILVNIVYTTVMYSMSALNRITNHISANMFRIDTGFGFTSALSWIYFVVIIATLGLLVTGFVLFEKKQARR